MNSTVLRYVFGLGAAALLSACGAQPDGAVTGEGVPASETRVLPKTSDAVIVPKPLLYASSTTGAVYVYSYPGGRVVQKLAIPQSYGAPGLCADGKGDVFIPSVPDGTTGASTIYEYAHGGSQPINELVDTGIAYGCSVDTRSGNLAVSNGYDSSNPYSANQGSLAIYTLAQGTPKVFYSSGYAVYMCGYDGSSKLYVVAFSIAKQRVRLARFSSATNSLDPLNLSVTIYDAGGSFEPVVQWDGLYVTISSNVGVGRPLIIYRLRISGNNAKVVGTTTLETAKNRPYHLSFIVDDHVMSIMSDNGKNDIITWAYPAGGLPKKQIKTGPADQYGSLNGIVLSQINT